MLLDGARVNGLKNDSKQVKKPKKKPVQAAPPRDETPYSVLSYNETFLGRTLNDRAARKDGISLAHIAKLKAIEPGKAEHPVWKKVNTWPKWLLDRFYTRRQAKKAKEPQHQGSTVNGL